MTTTTVNEMRVVDKQRMPLERQNPVSEEKATGILREFFGGLSRSSEIAMLSPTAHTLSRWDPYQMKGRIRPMVTLVELPRHMSCEVDPTVIEVLL